MSPRVTAKRAFLAPELVAQLKTLFGTARNVHERLGLDPHVRLTEVQWLLTGRPGRELAERLIVRRWAEWRREFLADPDHPMTAEARSREAGDYYHAVAARDPITEAMPRPVARFTLLTDARET
jgi:hypothetical protein